MLQVAGIRLFVMFNNESLNGFYVWGLVDSSLAVLVAQGVSIGKFSLRVLRFPGVIRAAKASRLFVDPFECIGASVATRADYYESEIIRALRQFIHPMA